MHLQFFSVSCLFFLSHILVQSSVEAGYILNGSGLSGGSRWDAANTSFFGNERSLVGGLRYSVSGGSYQAFRDQFSWTAVPSIGAFQQAVEQAFSAWSSVDPVSNYGTDLLFVPDFGTQVVSGAGFGTLNMNGAEIDLIASNAGSNTLAGVTTLSFLATPVTLTSGVSNYTNSSAIAGVDLHLNNNPGAVYSLDAFRRILTHELGHAIGLNDVDLGTLFIDDNFDINSPATTLTNSWVTLVDPLDPANSSGLSAFSIPSSVFSTSGIDLLMESNGLGIGPTNPLTNILPLTNDEYGMRQFLYPTLTAVPEPSCVSLLVLFTTIFCRRRRRPILQHDSPCD